jgi:hypothetical protein
MNTDLGSFLLLEHIDGHVAQDGEVFWGMVLADSAHIFAKCDVQDPVETVLNAPMATLGLQESGGFHLATGDEIAGLDFHLVIDLPFRADHRQGSQVFPIVTSPQVIQTLQV